MLPRAISYLSSVATLYSGGSLILSGALTPGEFISFMFYTLYVGMAFTGITSFYGDVMKVHLKLI